MKTAWFKKFKQRKKKDAPKGKALLSQHTVFDTPYGHIPFTINAPQGCAQESTQTKKPTLDDIVTISISQDFTEAPGGRFKSDGPGSGEEFLETCLLPASKKGKPLKICLDGLYGMPPSFRDEAFGGLVRALSIEEGERVLREISFEEKEGKHNPLAPKLLGIMQDALDFKKK